MNLAGEGVIPAQPQDLGRLGTLGRLALFIGLIISAVQLPAAGLSVLLLLLLVAGLQFNQAALMRLARWRWLLFLVLVIVPTALWYGETDSTLAGIAYSTEGLQTGLAMALRAGIMLTGVLWFTASVDISELAGLLERAGLRGLGFSLGVAVNMLPTLLQSFRNAWYTFQMRGGARRLRLRTARLLLLTVFANAIRRADEITLVAESRAYVPDRSRSLPLKKGRFDLLVCGAIAAYGIALIVML